MTLKLTHNQAFALMHLFDKVINPQLPEDVAERLVKELMYKVYKKLRSVLEAKIKPRGYSLALTDLEAMAFYVYFQNRYLGPGWFYEQTVVDAQLAELDREYA
jgi:hypothetical protein